MKKLILWDIDGTLLHTNGIAAYEMRATMEGVFGPVKKRERVFYSGKTDWQIIHDTFPDLDPAIVADTMPVFVETYTKRLEKRRDDLRHQAFTMPGVKEIVAYLSDHAIQAPLTGNIAPVARIKLDVLGLLPYLHIDIGAYGNDHYDRAHLVTIATKRASQHYGYAFEGTNIIVIGDTPKDIACGKMSGAYTVAVATGPYSIDELRLHQPDAVLSDLSNTEEAIQAILA